MTAPPITRPTEVDSRPLRATHLRGVTAAAALTVLLGVLCALSLLVGARELTVTEVMGGLTGSAAHDVTVLVREMRLPRTAVAVAVGAALGVSGALIQALTRNPLADPGILGVNAGAAFGVTMTVAVLGQQSPTHLVPSALLGAAVTTIGVLALGSLGRGPGTPAQMTLAGVSIAAVLSGISAAFRLVDPRTFEQMRAWAAGAVTGRSIGDLAPLLPVMAVGAVIALLLARPLNAVALGEDRAASLGVSVRATRIGTVVAVTLLCGTATAIAGPIGFVGLIVPHAARWLVGPDHRWIVALSALSAPVLLLASDIAGRVLLAHRELPVGVVTAFVGAPVLIALVLRKRVSGL